MNQKIPFGGTIGFGDSSADFLFCDFKTVRLYAILHDAAGAVGSKNGKRSGNLLLAWKLTKVVFAFLPDWITLFSSRKTLCAFHF